MPKTKQNFFSKELILLFVILFVVAFFYHRYQNKLNRENATQTDILLQDYLLTVDDVVKERHRFSKKPILWIHIDYDYNARHWQSFGSRSSFQLNQPYLHLTVKSIIEHCKPSFHICLIDDSTFATLLPEWQVRMHQLADPIRCYMRELGLLKLLYRYGGFRVPASFVAVQDLAPLYWNGVKNNHVFVAEMVDRNVTSVHHDFYPSMQFMGAPKEHPLLLECVELMERKISEDYTSQIAFLGVFQKWCQAHLSQGQMNIVLGKLIGTMTKDGDPVLLDDLLSQTPISFDNGLYGIYVPADEILRRTTYEWFTRLSEKQVLQSNLVVSNYLRKNPVREPLQTGKKDAWVSFWKVPSGAPVWGLKPNHLGDFVPKEAYPQ